ncbi:hypothetical protein GGR53DRAFT_223110 [Hypoxylon sp. FL1150]|nr:hypothetical protein GGR53DRAFT_223110 [Hypoxylon sp. FL1150]
MPSSILSLSIALLATNRVSCKPGRRRAIKPDQCDQQQASQRRQALEKPSCRRPTRAAKPAREVRNILDWRINLNFFHDGLDWAVAVVSIQLFLHLHLHPQFLLFFFLPPSLKETFMRL